MGWAALGCERKLVGLEATRVSRRAPGVCGRAGRRAGRREGEEWMGWTR